jgi:hypothetical protein
MATGTDQVKSKNQTAQERKRKKEREATLPTNHMCAKDGNMILLGDLQPVMYTYPRRMRFFHKGCLELSI